MTCIFCKIASGDIPAIKVYEDDSVLAFLDISPVNPGHTLIIPKEHHKNLIDTPDELLCKIILAVKKLAPVVMRSVGAKGYNLGVNSGAEAGQVIFHTHFHIMPRFEGDGHKHWSKVAYKDHEAEKIAEKIKENLK